MAAATGSISAQPSIIPRNACIRAFIGRVRAHSAAASGVAGATDSARLGKEAKIKQLSVPIRQVELFIRYF
jgi:hypothetical protein